MHLDIGDIGIFEDTGILVPWDTGAMHLDIGYWCHAPESDAPESDTRPASGGGAH